MRQAIDIWVGNLLPYAITWGDMRDVLQGLSEVCDLQQCTFEFSIASGLRIGEGALYKA